MTVEPIPDGYHTLTLYINVKGAQDAIEFYKKAFGAKEIGRITMADGNIAHAEMQIGNSKIMLAEEAMQWGNKSPQTLGGSPVCLCLYVEDVDAVFAQALAAGANVTGDMEVKDQFYGDRTGSLTDPFGHQWSIMTHKEDVSFEEVQKRADALFKQAGAPNHAHLLQGVQDNMQLTGCGNLPDTNTLSEIPMNTDEQAIRNLVAQWHSATSAGNIEAVLRFMAKDVIFLVAGHPPMKGRSTFEQGLRELLTSHQIEATSEVQEIEVSGNLAYCWSMLNVRITPQTDGHSVLRSGSAVSILHKQSDGSWVVVRDANLLAPAT